MIVTDEDALVCDLAETYGIYDYRQLPANRVAVFSVGLSHSSRIKRSLSGQKEDTKTLLLAGVYDMVHLLLWAKTKDGAANRNRPSSMVDRLLQEPVEREEMVFVSGEDFERQLELLKNQIGGAEDGDDISSSLCADCSLS